MLRIIDRLALGWIDWRRDREIKRSPMLCKVADEFGLRELRSIPGGWEGTFITPAVVVIAEEMAAMLNKASAENHVVFDFLPRIDRGVRPVRVTVQWAHGKNPAQVNAELKKQVAELERRIEDLTYAALEMPDET